MAGPVDAWMDALGGNMSFGQDRSKYYTLPPKPQANGIEAFIHQLLNETLLMPQTLTQGVQKSREYMNPMSRTAPAAPIMPAGPPMTSPATPNANLTRPQMTRPGGASGANQTFSIPLAAPQDYWSMVNSLEGTGKNPKSTSVGPGQFTDGTFDEYLKSTGKALGQNGVPADRTAAKQALGQEATMWYKDQNAKVLGSANIPVNNTTLYGAHFLGPGGLTKIWQADPKTPVAQVLDANAIASNPEILSGKTAGEVKAWLEKKTNGNVLPSPPMADAPPQMAMPGKLDFTQANNWLDQAKPKPVDGKSFDSLNLSNVLGGMAKGAASVDATAAGSFASALAAAGAGGSQGMSDATKGRITANENKDIQNQNYAMNRAGQATSQMTADHQNEIQQNQVAFSNAKNTYDTIQQNKVTQYEGDVKERAARMPQVTADANGMLIKQYNPATNSMDIKYHNTKSIMDKAESAVNVVKALGASGPVAESMLITTLGESMKDNPVLYQTTLEREAVRRTIANGAGTAVFGNAFDAAYKAAEKRAPAALQKEPEKYLAWVNDMAAADLYNAIQKKGDKGWLKAAQANGSVIAGVLLGGAQ